MFRAKIRDFFGACSGRDSFYIGMAIRALLLRARRHLRALVVAVALRATYFPKCRTLRPGEFRARHMLFNALMASHAFLIPCVLKWNPMTRLTIRSKRLMALRQRSGIPCLCEFCAHCLRDFTHRIGFQGGRSRRMRDVAE